MDGVDLESGALGEAVVFLGYFRDMPDARQSAKVMYPLDEVLLLSLLAVLAGAETFVAVTRFRPCFGERKLDFLRRFRPILSGTPSHDHLGDILGIGAELGNGSSNDIARAIRHGTEGTVNQAGQQIVSRQLDVPPTITIRPGTPVRELVTRDSIIGEEGD